MNILLIADQSEHQTKFSGLLELAFPEARIVDTIVDSSLAFCLHSEARHFNVVLFLPIESSSKRNELLRICESQNLQVMCIVSQISKEDSFYLLKHGVKALIGLNASMDTLRNGIKFVREGGMYFDPQIFNGDDLQVAFKTFQQEEFPNLTKRQWEIYRLIAKGFTNNEIGEKLRLKPATVSSHTKEIRKTTQSKTIPGAIAKGFFYGWLKNI
jgi:DNA-binding NarL/FixJ family response regulator